MEEKKQNILPEAPASVTVKVRSEAGFEYMFTMRNESAKELLFRMKKMEEHWLANGFTPLAQNAYQKQAKQKDYIEGRVCPVDGGKLFNWVSKDGTKKAEKCDNGKFDFTTKQQTGCGYIKWL